MKFLKYYSVTPTPPPAPDPQSAPAFRRGTLAGCIGGPGGMSDSRRAEGGEVAR